MNATTPLARLAARRAALCPPALLVEGRLTRMVGLTLEAVGCRAAVGAHCVIEAPDGSRVEAEVVGFANDRTYLMPISDMRGFVPDSRVLPSARRHRVPVGDGLLGRVLDGAGRPLDARGALRVDEYRALGATPVNPLLRAPIRAPLDVGVRAINGLLRIGRGQRLGLFAGSGVGKSTLGLDGDALWAILIFAGSMFAAAVKVALPAVTALLGANIMLGVITRSAPQLNLFAFGLPITTALGLVLLLAALPGLAPAMAEALDAVLAQLAGIYLP
jgi:hypothetical protein